MLLSLPVKHFNSRACYLDLILGIIIIIQLVIYCRLYLFTLTVCGKHCQKESQMYFTESLTTHLSTILSHFCQEHKKNCQKWLKRWLVVHLVRAERAQRHILVMLLAFNNTGQRSSLATWSCTCQGHELWWGTASPPTILAAAPLCMLPGSESASAEPQMKTRFECSFTLWQLYLQQYIILEYSL